MDDEAPTLVEFVESRLDEDEDVARACGSTIAASWHREGMGSIIDAGDAMVVLSDANTTSTEQAAHIARHDPARVLAEVAAKRAIVDAYREVRSRRDIYQSAEMRAVEDAEQAARRRSAAARCRGLEIAVELLAGAYADHPDYRQLVECEVIE